MKSSLTRLLKKQINSSGFTLILKRSEGEDAHPRSIWIYRNEGTLQKFFPELPDGIKNQRSARFRGDILSAYLNDTRSCCTRRCQQGAKIQVMRENNETVFLSVVHDFAIFGGGRANVGPVDTF
jgi:hypothetical protein